LLELLRRLADRPARYRNPRAHAAFHAAVLELPPSALCLSVGGGPTVVHPRLVNLNLSPFANVHVVGSAYKLPFVDGSVDATYCEAVLEHLEYPDSAVAEMARVLKPAGQVFAVTPLLQPYHGHPDHFQNFTLNGHVRLFERAGFEVLASGPCNGPAFAMLDLAANFAREYVPTRWMSRSMSYLVRLVGAPWALADRVLLAKPSAHRLASTTFVHAAKRG
jgi:SAM-dependent methyltransferase